MVFMWQRLHGLLPKRFRQETSPVQPSSPRKYRRVRTPTLLQLEAVECGAAALGIILGYHGRIVPLPQLRQDCGVSRDGSTAGNIVLAAQSYGLKAKGFKKSLQKLPDMPLPNIVFWHFNHFLVVEGYSPERVYLNDPATGRRSVTWQEFDEGYTGIVLVFEPGERFERGGHKPSLYPALWQRLRSSLPALLYAVMAGFLLVVPGLALPVFSQVFVDQVLVEGRQDWLSPLLLGMALTLVLQGLLKFLQLRYLRLLRLKLAVGMSSRFLWHLLHLPISFYAQRFAGEIANRQPLNDKIAEVLSGKLATTVIDGAMIIFYAGIMFAYDWPLTVIGIGFAIAKVSALQWVAQQRVDANFQLVQYRGKVAGVAIAALQSIETLKSAALESDLFTRWAGYYAKYLNAHQELEISNQLISVLPVLLTSITTLLILILGGWRVMEGNLSIGMLIAFQSLMISFQEPVNRLVNFGSSLQELESDLNLLDDVLQNSIQVQSPTALAASDWETDGLQGYLEFRNVTFGYSRVSPPLIENLSFCLRPGERVAFIGGSGSGKSTIAKLASGLYKPWSGEILYDGKPANAIPAAVLTQGLGMVEQEIFLFAGSVRENLTLWDDTVPDADLKGACQDAAIEDVVLALPGGYSGPLLEGATNLSGGQRQRLEIARTLVNNPAILILDEATAALDAETEQTIDRNLRRRGCTCLIVAHRLSTIRDCDQIIVLNAGKVVQSGTHAQLWCSGGLYSQLLRSEGEALGQSDLDGQDDPQPEVGLAPQPILPPTASPLYLDHYQSHTYATNQPLYLDDSQTVWLVQSGALALFAIHSQGNQLSRRRYLFSCSSGQVILSPTPPLANQQWQLLAVPLEEVQLLPLSWTQISNWCEAGQPESIAWLEGWKNNLLEPIATVLPEAKTLLEAPPLTLSSPSPTIAAWQQLEQLHHFLFQSLDLREQQDSLLQWQRFQSREALNHRATQTALFRLSALTRPQNLDLASAGDPLLVAIGAVGRSLGVKIVAPEAEGVERQDRLVSIAQASRLPLRKVILSDRWWTKECGPLLAYTQEQHQPVALLPRASGGYELFNPQQATKVFVGPQIAATLESAAYMLYRSLPSHSLKAIELLQFAFNGQSRNLRTIILSGILAAALGMLTPIATGILIDQAIPNRDQQLLWQLGAGLILAALGTAVFQFTQGLNSLRLESSMESGTQSAVWNHLLNLPVSFFRRYANGDLLSRVNGISQIRQKLSGSTLRTLLTSGFSFLNLGLLFYYNSALALVAIAAIAIVLIVLVIAGSLSLAQLRPLQELEGEIFGFMVQLISGVSKLHIAGAQERAFAYWSQKYSQKLQLVLRSQGIEDWVVTFNTLLPSLTALLLFWVVIHLLSGNSQDITTGTYLAFTAAFTTLITAATELSNTLLEVLQVRILWQRSQPILSAQPEVAASKADPGRLSGRIAIEQVRFRYREDGPLTLADVTLQAEPGEFIALVGPSGSGKSTLLRLLLGFEKPESGRVSYDGQDLSGLDLAAVRRQLGVVIQNGRINSASIFENISSGALVTMPEAELAAQRAGLAEDIAAMPMGMHTVISEGGTNLSGGQRQRLLIARSLVRNPKILLFDEATSALDNRTQAIVTQSLEQMQVTRIVIAHRLSTVRQADRIYVLDKGRVIQQGSFTELSQQRGLFAQLMARQMLESFQGSSTR